MLRPKKTAEIILKYHPAVQLELQDGLRKSVTGCGKEIRSRN